MITGIKCSFTVIHQVLRPRLRSKFCNIMQAVYVDTSEHSALEVPFNTRPWDRSDETDIFPRYDDKGQFSMLQAFVEKYLEIRHLKMNRLGEIFIDDDEKQEMLELDYSVLRLCELLLRFGCFSSNDEICHVAWYLLEALCRQKSHEPVPESPTFDTEIDHDDEYTQKDDEYAHEDDEYARKNTCGACVSSMGACRTKVVNAICTAQFIDSIFYTAFMLLVTVISFTLWLIETIFAWDDETRTDRWNFGDNWYDSQLLPLV